MVDVAHDHHDRRALHEALGCVLIHLEEPLLDGDMHLPLDLRAQLLGHDGGGVKVDGLADAGHHAEAHQLFDDRGGGGLEAGSQLAHRDLVRNLHLELGLAGLFQLDALQPLGLGLPPALEGLAAAVFIGVAELLLVARRGGLAAVFDIFRPRQLGVFFIELVEVDIHRAGVHHLGDHLALGFRGLGRGLLLLGLGLFGPRHLDHRAVRLFQHLALLGLGLGGAGKVFVEARLLVGAGEMLKNVVQLLLLEVRAGLFGRAAKPGQQLQHLLGRDVEVLCHFTDLVFDLHSIHSSFRLRRVGFI